MSDHDPWESAMSRDFDARVRDLHEAPLHLRDVRDTARSIKRRRRATTAGGVLAAAAIVVPVALLAGLPGTEDRSGPGPAEDPTTPGETAVAEPAEPTYLAEGTWHRADGSEVPLPAEDYYDAVVWDDQLVAVRFDGEDSTADVITREGTVVDSFATTGDLAVNEAGTTLAYVDEAGYIVTRHDDAEHVVPTGTDPVGMPRLVAITGGPDCAPDADGCVAYTQRTAYSASGTGDEPVPGAVSLNDATEELLAVTDEATDDSSCGGAYDVGAADPRWRTCDYSVLDIAPGGGYVLGTDAYLDGLGQTFLALLDARTGEEVARYEAGADRTFPSYAWANRSQILISVYDYNPGTWHLVLMGEDGSVTEVAEPAPGTEFENPFTPVRR